MAEDTADPGDGAFGEIGDGREGIDTGCAKAADGKSAAAQFVGSETFRAGAFGGMAETVGDLLQE